MKSYKNLNSSGFVGAWGSVSDSLQPTKKEVDFILNNFDMIHNFVIYNNYASDGRTPFPGCGCLGGMSIYYLHPLFLYIITDYVYFFEYFDESSKDIVMTCGDRDGDDGFRTLSICVCDVCREKFFITENSYPFIIEIGEKNGVS